MVDQTGIVPDKASPEGDADVPEHGQVQHRLSVAKEMVDQNSASWNRVAQWLVHLQAVQQAASALA